MNWLLFEDKIIALDKFNTMLNPIMFFIVIVLLIVIIIGVIDYMEYDSIGEHIFSENTRNIIKTVYVVVLLLIIIVGITNTIEHYLHELMKFDGYMYIDYAKKIIEI